MNHPMRIYLDNCCYNRPYDDQSQIRIRIETQAKLYIQQLIREQKLELATSYVLLAENYANPFPLKQSSIKSFIDTNSTFFISRQLQEAVQEKATLFMKTGIKYADACHVACAILANCDYFITTDRRLLRFQTDDLKLITPVDFVNLEEEYD